MTVTATAVRAGTAVGPVPAAGLEPARSTEPTGLLRARRSRTAQTWALTGVAGLSVTLLAVQLGTVDLIGAVGGAQLRWLAVAAAASLVPFSGAALSLAASPRVDFRSHGPPRCRWRPAAPASCCRRRSGSWPSTCSSCAGSATTGPSRRPRSR